jgi:hypothetical protein
MRGLVVSFMAAKGLSQASPDWLSGTYYREHLAIPVKLAEWFAALSVITQMIGGATLLFRDGRYFWTGWILLFFFECTHLYMGELLASSTAMGALLYVLFDEFELRKNEREYIYQSFIRPEPSFLWGGVVLGVFWLAQLAPMLHIDRQSTLGSVLDIWAMHPEAAQEECDQRTFAIYKNRTEMIEVEPKINRQASMVCNVYMRFLDLKALCNQLQTEDSEFITLASVLDVRRFRDRTSFRAFEIKDFCSPNVTYKKLDELRWNTNPGK